MFKIPKIETPTFYFDQTIKSMESFAEKKRVEIEKRFSAIKKPKKRPLDEVKLNKRKDLELEKIRYLNKKLEIKIKKVIRSFPKFSNIEQIYKDLIDTTETKCIVIEDALRRLLWITNKIDEFTYKTEIKIKRAKTNTTINFIMKKHLGRLNSLFKKNHSYFEILESARKFMNRLPEFKKIPTIAICGYPNVGKSTLLKKLTGSDVEIQNYPFTTKGLMFGYIEKNNKKIIQMIDTPGLLGRDKNNSIEQRAEIVLTKYADLLIFVIDPTETCGYSMKNQIKLLKKILSLKKIVLIYISKTDLDFDEIDENLEQNKQILKKYELFKEPILLLNKILDIVNNKGKKTDITKIKVIK